MNGVALTDNGSLALVAQDNRATSCRRAVATSYHHSRLRRGIQFLPDVRRRQRIRRGRINFDVYAYNGTTYNRVIHLTRANFWFGGAVTVSHDGSTVGTFGGNYANRLA